MRRTAFAIAAALAWTSAATARDWPRAGGFDIVEAEEACFLTTEYQGPGETRLTVALYRDQTALILVDNYNWSSKKDEVYTDISFRLNGESYGGGKAVGTEDGIRHGFGVRANADFLRDFTASTYLHVYKGQQIIDRLNLNGSAAAAAQVRRCVAHVEKLRSAEERERKRWEDLPKDPFAKK